MPENQEKGNNLESQAMDDKNQAGSFGGVTPQSAKEFEKVLEEVRRGMETQVNQEKAEVMDQSSPLSAIGEIAARKAAESATKEYREKTIFERANLGFQKPQNSPRAYDTTEPQKDEMELAKAEKRKEIEEKAMQEAKENMTAEQQRTIMIAGDKAISILAKVAEEMAHVAEGGGIMGELVILLTFVLAISKDLTDEFLAILSVSTLPIPVLDIVFPVSIKLLSWIIGFIASTVLIFFWMTVSGNWKGGLATNWILKVILRFVVGGMLEGIISILPVYTVLNIWCYYDYRKGQRDAAENIENVQDEAKEVQNRVNTDLRNINTASS